MSFKRVIAFILVLLVAMTMLAGCGSKVEEEAGLIGEFVEDQEQEIKGDKPEKGEESEIVEDDETEEPSDQDEKPSKEEQSPSDKEEQKPGNQEEPKEEQKDTDKEEQTDKDQQTQKPSGNNQQTQKPNNNQQTQKPNNNQQTQKPNNNQQTQTPSQDENVEDEFEDEFEDEYEEDEDYTDEDEDGEWDGGSYPSGGTPVQKPNLNTQDALIANTLKIVAYNVRMKNDGNGNDIADRQPRFKAMVEELQPDIMGLSEANSAWIKYLENNIVGSKYEMVYTYRAPKDKEAQPLIFDKNKFELMDWGYFWLSETPDVASKGWGGEYYRGATWGKLRVRDTGKTFLYYSTHLTGNEKISVPSVKLIYEHAVARRGFTDYPVFVSGDFNFVKDSAGYKEITKNFMDVNMVLGYNPTVTYNAYKEDGSGTLIDYVMCSSNGTSPKKYQVIQKKYLNGYISDHRGLYVETLLT